MIKKVTELNCMGFNLKHVKNTGWKIVLDGVEFIFPTLDDAKMVCMKFRDIVKENSGKEIK